MAFNWQISNGLQLLRSSLLAELGVKHAFTTRIGGRSTGPYESLNLDVSNSCPPDQSVLVRANYQLLRTALDCVDCRLASVDQCHGAEVATVDQIGASADALVSNLPEWLLTIRIADCVPILIASRDGSVVAAVHAGWRGLVSGVIGNAIAEMRSQFAALPEHLYAAVGPSIGLDAFEVGEEVAQAFEAVQLHDAIERYGYEKPHVDLKQAAGLQLEKAGISLNQIDICEQCTFEQPQWFFSHRRDKGKTGRMAAVIVARPE